MAVANVSATHQNTVGAILERPQNMMGRHGCRTHDTDRPDIGGVAQSAHTGQIRRPIGAPVTHEGDDLRFKSVFFHNTLLNHP